MRSILISLLILTFLVGCQTTPKVEEEPKEGVEMDDKLEGFPKLNRADKKIRKRLIKSEEIDGDTFMKTSDNIFQGIRVYRAMPEGWQGMDPPSTDEFFVTPADKIFPSIIDALTSIKYVPKDEKDALDVALVIVSNSTDAEAKVVTDPSQKIDFVPKDILEKQNITAPLVIKDNHNYKISMLSYVSYRTANRFEPGYRALKKHEIDIKDGAYSQNITIIWEERGWDLKK